MKAFVRKRIESVDAQLAGESDGTVLGMGIGAGHLMVPFVGELNHLEGMQSVDLRRK